MDVRHWRRWRQRAKRHQTYVEENPSPDGILEGGFTAFCEQCDWYDFSKDRELVIDSAFKHRRENC